MCNRARLSGEPETIIERFGTGWITPKPMDNRFNPMELYPKSRAYVVREQDGERGLDIMNWDVTAGAAPWAMTNVRNLALPQWKALAAKPEHRCLIPLTDFCEWTPKPIERGDGKKPIKDEMWFDVLDQDVFAIAGFWRPIGDHRYFAMVTCDPNELVAPIHPKAMITILQPADYEQWLSGSYKDVVALQQPYPADHMSVRGPTFPTRNLVALPDASSIRYVTDVADLLGSETMNGHDEATALARSIFELRRMRADHLPEVVLSEIAWNILLALFVADADGSRMKGQDVLAVAEAPVSTGRRWIMALHREGLVIGDGHGHLEDVIGLTPKGISAVEACMIDAQKFLQTRLSRSAAA